MYFVYVDTGFQSEAETPEEAIKEAEAWFRENIGNPAAAVSYLVEEE